MRILLLRSSEGERRKRIIKFKFVEILTEELGELAGRQFTPEDVEAALIRAANRTLEERGEPDLFRLTRYVVPEDCTILTRLEDVGTGDNVWLSAAEVALLRTLLMTWDETAPPRAGDPYLVPIRGRDGRRYSTYRPEHRPDRAGQ